MRRNSFSLQKTVNEFEPTTKIKKYIVKNELEQKFEDSNTINKNFLDLENIKFDRQVIVNRKSPEETIRKMSLHFSGGNSSMTNSIGSDKKITLKKTGELNEG